MQSNYFVNTNQAHALEKDIAFNKVQTQNYCQTVNRQLISFWLREKRKKSTEKMGGQTCSLGVQVAKAKFRDVKYAQISHKI
jgi:hypothetical protein